MSLFEARRRPQLVSGKKNVLTSILCILSVLLFMHFNGDIQPHRSRRRSSPAHDNSSSGLPKECNNLFSIVKADGTLKDPNYVNESFVGNAIHPKETNTLPSFWVSLHNEKTDPVRWGIMRTGDYYESFVTQSIKTVLSQQSNPDGTKIFIDVGMNIGWYSLWALRLGATVYSFEPNPLHRLRFCESLKLNRGILRGGRAHLYPIALGDNVRVRRLDDVTKEAGLFDDNYNIALLKIDVEGHDPNILFGAQELLESQKVQNIFMEYSCDLTSETDLTTVVDQVAKAGYDIEVIGNWNGSPRLGAKENVRTTMHTGLGSRLYAYCRSESWLSLLQNTTLHLNIWWKLI